MLFRSPHPPQLQQALGVGLAPLRALRRRLKDADLEGLKIDWVFEDMLRRGVASWVLATHAGALCPEEAFLLGMLQDSGLLHLALNNPEKAYLIEEMAALPASRRIQLEEHHFGQNHAQAYAEAVDLVGLPPEWSAIVAAHHTTRATLPSREHQRLLDLCRAADALADLTQAEASAGTLETLKRYLERLPSRRALDPRVLFDALREAMPGFAQVLGWPIESQPVWSELQRESGPSPLFVSPSFESLTRDLAGLEQQRQGVRDGLREQLLPEPPDRDPTTGVLTYRGLTRHLRGALDKLVLDQTPFALLWVSGPKATAFEQINLLLRSSDAMCWHQDSWLIYLSDTGFSGCKIVQNRIETEVIDLQAIGCNVQAGQGLLPGVNGIVEHAREAAMGAN